MGEFMSQHPLETVLAIIGLNGLAIAGLAWIATKCGPRKR